MPLLLSSLLLLPLLIDPALAQEAAPPPPEVTIAPGRGFTVTSADGRSSMNVRARFQLRESLTAATCGADDGEEGCAWTLQTQLFTTRVWLAGTALSPDVSWLLQLAVGPRDYRDGAISPVYDAYFDFTKNPNLSFRVGQLFVPFDRLRTIREFALQLPDRPRVVSELTLDRDVGAYAYSDRFGGEDSPLAWRLGVFGGNGIHQGTAREPGALLVGRLELRPLGPIDDDSEGDLKRTEEPRLALGVGAAYNHDATRARSTTSASYTGGSIDYRHLAADLVFKWRGFAAEAEGVLRDASADRIVSTDAESGAEVVEYSRSGWGVVGQASQMLGERVEVVGRYGRLAALPDTDPAYAAEAEAYANEFVLGSNVYLNGHRFKIQQSVGAFVGDDVPLREASFSGHVLLDVMF